MSAARPIWTAAVTVFYVAVLVTFPAAASFVVAYVVAVLAPEGVYALSGGWSQRVPFGWL